LSLRTIMRQQLFKIPFENLDIQSGKVVSLAPEDIVDKIVFRRRGGYCYELNGLFAMALESLGIEYTFIAARPMPHPIKHPKTHIAILAAVGGKQWLCDLGFGSFGIREPIDIELVDCDIWQDNDQFKLSKTRKGEFLLKARVDGIWVNQYTFNLSACEWIDFEPANYFCSTHPSSIFTQKPVIIIHNPLGRTTLFGGSLKTTQNGVVTRTSINNIEIKDILETLFRISSDVLANEIIKLDQ